LWNSMGAGSVMYISCAKLLLSSIVGVEAGGSDSFCPGCHTPLCARVCGACVWGVCVGRVCGACVWGVCVGRVCVCVWCGVVWCGVVGGGGGGRAAKGEVL
jgi:hypothetical protein